MTVKGEKEESVGLEGAYLFLFVCGAWCVSLRTHMHALQLCLCVYEIKQGIKTKRQGVDKVYEYVLPFP